MKKFLRVVCSVVLMVLIMTILSCDGGADGEVKFATTKIPLPLGRYVQLAHPYATFSLSDPDGNGNGEFGVDLDFEILRHVPNPGLLYFKIETKDWFDGVDPILDFRLKAKNDPDAMVELGNAISDSECSRVSVTFHRNYENIDEAKLENVRKQWNDMMTVEFESPSIAIKVPQSQIHVIGDEALGVKVARPATIRFYSRNDNVYLDVEIELMSPLNHQVPVTLRTQDGSYEASLMGVPYLLETTPMLGHSNFYTPLTDMDKLLSSPIDIYIDMK